MCMAPRLLRKSVEPLDWRLEAVPATVALELPWLRGRRRQGVWTSMTQHVRRPDAWGSSGWTTQAAQVMSLQRCQPRGETTGWMHGVQGEAVSTQLGYGPRAERWTHVVAAVS